MTPPTEMEEKDIPESDREELRTFADFLEWRKNKKPGEEVPKDMREWLGLPPTKEEKK